MPDPVMIAGWIAAVVVIVVQEVRVRIQARPAAVPATDVNELRVMIREELDPIKELADKNDHDNAINRKEIGYATAEIKHFGRKLDEFKGEVESKLARQGEAFDERVATAELKVEQVRVGLERVIVDTESRE